VSVFEFTLGVEEEYHLVDAGTYALRSEPDAVPPADARLGGQGGATAEITTTQLEISTPICRTLADVRAQLRRARRAAGAAAAERGCRILAAGSHPFAPWQALHLTGAVRYLELLEQWGILAIQQGIAGCHVHVAIPDPDTGIAVMDRARPWLPVLLALTGSSPFWEGFDTGYASYRTLWFGRWATTGTPEPLGDRAGYDAVVAELVRTGVIDDASFLYWDIRPSQRYPTLEFRVADVCPAADDAVLHAGLVRSLVRTLAGDAAADRPVPVLRPEVVRAARWRAARYGVDGELYDPLDRTLRPAADVVRRLLGVLRDDLVEHGEWEEVAELATRTLARGTSSRRQRALMAETGGDLVAVTAELVRETNAGAADPSSPPLGEA
jgi:carboxylate-amine ligase